MKHFSHALLLLSVITSSFSLGACREFGSDSTAVFEKHRRIYYYQIQDVKILFSEDSINNQTSLSIHSPEFAIKLALWELTSMKPGQPNINSSGINIDNASLKQVGNGMYELNYSDRFSTMSIAPEQFKKYRHLREFSDQSARVVFRDAPTCFRYYLEMVHKLPYQAPIDVEKYVNEVTTEIFNYSYAGTCEQDHADKYLSHFDESKVTFLNAEQSDSSVAPDLKKLTADGKLNFYFMYANDKMRAEGLYPEAEVSASSEGTSGTTFNLLDVQDTLVQETLASFETKFGSPPKAIAPGIYEFTSSKVLPNVQTRLVVHHVSQDLDGAIAKLANEIPEIDVFSYNGHANLGNSKIFDFFNNISASLNRYKILALNACWTSSFFLREVAPGSQQNFDFIGHSETIVFQTFPMLNRVLFETVVGQRPYQEFIDLSVKAVSTEKGSLLERTRETTLKKGLPIEDLLPGTIVFERTQTR